jgi:hypothetical protein
VEQRRDKYYITHMFPKFSADDLVDKIVGGHAVDPMYPKKESMKEVRERVREVLKTIFVDENEDKKCKICRLFPSSLSFGSDRDATIICAVVSITTHSGFMKAFLRAVGRGPYHVPNGSTSFPCVVVLCCVVFTSRLSAVLPLIIQFTKN